MRLNDRSMVIIAGVIGAAVWFLVAGASGRREAWDSELYWSLGMPVVGLCAAVLGFLTPERPWRWGMAPLAGQAVAAFVRDPTANLLPLGLIVFAVLGGLCSIPAYIGAALGRLARRRSDGP